MGKGLLFMLAGVMLASGYLLYDMQRVGVDTRAEQTNYEEAVVAREIAQSAFDQAVSEVQRDFKNGRPAFRGEKYQGGAYDLTATTIDENNVQITVEGNFGGATVTMEGTLKRTLDEFLAALTLDVDGVVDPKADDKMTITGNDTPPPSEGGGLSVIGEGDGPDAKAFLAVTEAVRDKVADKFPHEKVYGAGGTGDFQYGDPDVDIDRLYTETLMHPMGEVFPEDKYKDLHFGSGPAHIFTGSKKKEFENITFGSSVSPAVARIKAVEVKFNKDVTGYGVLYINAEKIEFKENFRWEGLVLIDIVSEKGLVKIDKGQVFGAMVVRRGEEEWEQDHDDDNQGLAGGHFDVDVFGPYKGRGMKKVYHQHQYDDKFDVTGVDLMSAGCGGGGLCLSDLVLGAGYDEVRVEFFNAGWSSGEYRVVADGNTYTGDPSSGFSQTLDPSKLTQFSVNFLSLLDLWATSPGKVQSDDVNRNNAFTVRMYDKQSNDMVYELSVYEHNNSRCNIDCETEGTGDASYEVDYGEHESTSRFDPIKIEIKDTDAGVFYSTEALMRLESILDSVAKKIQPTIIDFRTRGSGLNGDFSTE